jgi:antitoxin VapB
MDPMKKGDVAKVFWSGRSQAIRLPKKYRLACREVRIQKEGDRLVIEPPATALDERGWPVGFWSIFGKVDESFDVGDRAQRHERSDPLR